MGGIVSNGLTNADIQNRHAVAGLFYEFTRRILDQYRTTYGPDSPQVKACKDGYHFEPSVAEKTFLDTIRGEGERIRLLYRHRVQEAIVDSGRLVYEACKAGRSP